MSIVATPHPLSQTYPAVPESVPLIRRGLVAFAREAAVDEDQIDALRLAISEAATNVVRHAYDGGEGLIHVSAAIASDELWVLIGDDGRGLERRSGRPGLGMGLALIASVADYFAVVKRSSGGTELRLRFGVTAEPFVAPEAQRRGSVASARSAA